MALDAEQATALQNLSRKAAGQHVDWINISAARALTAAGLAERDRQGWRITTAGEAALQSGSDPAPTRSEAAHVIRMVR